MPKTIDQYFVMLVEDSTLYQDIFLSTAEESKDFIHLDIYTFSDDAEKKFKEYVDGAPKPDAIFVDVNLDGSTYNGLELIRKINFEWGNAVVVGVISTSSDEDEIAIAKKNGAQFWIHKSADIDLIFPEFMNDLPKYRNRTLKWKFYGD